MLQARINKYLAENCKMERGSPLLLGVSGGADSLALLNLLVESSWNLGVAHFNHHLRPEAEDDAAFVAETAKQLALPFYRGDGDVAHLAASDKISVEAAARKARYRFLMDTAATYQMQAVVTAHNADDQVETVLLHLLRGSGLTGLRGMQPRTILSEFSTSIPLVRPMLTTWRTEIDEYCSLNGLNPRIDRTNSDPAYTRNRIRQQLIPTLETYNPRIKSGLAALVEIVSNTLEILEPMIQKAYDDAFISTGEGFRGFSRDGLVGLSTALQVEVIREAINQLLPSAEDIDSAAFERAVKLLRLKKRVGKIDLADGLIAQVDGERFLISLNGVKITDPAWPVVIGGQSVVLPVPGCVSLENDWIIQSEWMDVWDNSRELDTDPKTALLDASTLSFPLLVRVRKTGDVFQPLGMIQGGMTLGDFYTNIKMPRDARPSWPVVVSDQRIVWVPSYRIADFCRVNENSRKLVRLRLLKTMLSN